jgi:hypothetical protein
VHELVQFPKRGLSQRGELVQFPKRGLSQRGERGERSQVRVEVLKRVLKVGHLLFVRFVGWRSSLLKRVLEFLAASSENHCRCLPQYIKI